ncbi:MAG: nucleotidyltransferase [Sedimentisphaerales bacterium]|nr:nucleotidyltransferase [Sedimentisphaerales bacterium]
MLQSLLDHKVEFLVVGAYAMAAHGYPRATGDLDLWVFTSRENAEKVYKALGEFGAPLEQIDKDSFSEKGIIFQIGVAPCRIDIITQISGVEFEQAYPKRKDIEIDGIKLPIISKEDLIRNKESTGREKDKLDSKFMRE